MMNNDRAPVSTPQLSPQRASVDTLSAIADSIECDGLVRTAAKLREEIAHINAWGSAGSGAIPDLEYEDALRNQVLEEAALACYGERVDADETKAPEDAAYNQAIENCMDAIRNLAAAPSPAPQGEQA